MGIIIKQKKSRMYIKYLIKQNRKEIMTQDIVDIC